MDDKMEYQVQRQHPASITGYDLHQHQVDQRLHSPVLESTHRNNDNPSFPSSTSYQPVEHHPHQQHQYFHQPNYSHQPPAGFNGPFTSSPLFNAQPVVQQTPPQSSAGCFPLDREQFIEHQFQQMHQLLQLQYQQTMESINQQFHLFSLYWSTRQQPHNSQPPISTAELVQNSSPHQASVQHSIGTTAVCKQQPSMDQLIVPAPTTCDDRDEQQRQKQQSKTPIALLAAPDGSEENEFEHTRQNEYTAEVFNAYKVGSPREAIIIFDQVQPTNTKCAVHECDISAVECVTRFHQIDPKFVQHFLDRNGHQMDLTSGSAAVFSDLFVWIVNHGGTRIKLRWSNSSSRQHDHRPRYQHCPPSPLFPRLKTAAMETPSTIQRGRC